MNYITSKNVSIAFGIAFIAVGLLGFIPNPLVSPHGTFEVNIMHNLLHVLAGIVFIVGALPSERAARITVQALGIAAVGLAILGFLTKDGLLLGLVHVNEADKYLHAGFALVILVAGFGIPRLRATLGRNFRVPSASI